MTSARFLPTDDHIPSRLHSSDFRARWGGGLAGLALLVFALPAGALINYVGGKIDPPLLAPLGNGSLRVLAFAQVFSESGDSIKVCAPAGVTLGTPRNTAGNQPALVVGVSGSCATATAQTPTVSLQAYAVDFPFTLSSTFNGAASLALTVTTSSSGSPGSPANVPLLLQGSGPHLRILSDVHSFLDFRYHDICLIGSPCWFAITVTNDGDAPAAGWQLNDHLPFACTSIASSERGALPVAAPSLSSGFTTLQVPGVTLPPFSTETFLVNCTAPNTPYALDANTASLAFNGSSNSSSVSFEILGIPPPIARAASATTGSQAAASLLTQTSVFGMPDDRLAEVAPGDVVFFVTTVANVGNAPTPDAVGIQGLLDSTATGGALSLVSSTSYVLRADSTTTARLPCAGTSGAPESCQTPGPLQPGDTAVAVRLVRVSGMPPGGALILGDQGVDVGTSQLPSSTSNAVPLGVLPSLGGGCVGDGNHLCLEDQRFELGAAWTTFGSPPQSGRGNPVALLPGSVTVPDTGYFWFFDPANVELVAKALDGTAVNNDFWIFYGALSSVEYVLTARDTATGSLKSYVNSNGQLASVADTTAFKPAAGADEEPPVAFESGAPLCTSAGNAATQCARGPNNLCLLGSRFRVSVAWQTPDGRHGAGNAVGITSDTGYFWFFNQSNAELVLKALDGTGFNGKFWIFYGALSDVAYTITVADTQTGRSRTYVNRQGNLASVADTNAF